MPEIRNAASIQREQRELTAAKQMVGLAVKRLEPIERSVLIRRRLEAIMAEIDIIMDPDAKIPTAEPIVQAAPLAAVA